MIAPPAPPDPPPPPPALLPARTLGVIKQIPAHPGNYSPVSRHSTQVQAITLHSTEGHEGLTAAEDLGRMFAGLLTPKRSCHYGVDGNSVCQYVPDLHTAWQCGHTGNQFTIGIELCGTAKQSRDEWLDRLSKPALALCARLVAELCARYQLPVKALGPVALRAGERGITTHAAISQAWRQSTHTDPGAHFPMTDFVLAVEIASASLRVAPAPPTAPAR